MPKKYICNICDFETINKTKYNRHLKTKKHIVNSLDEGQPVNTSNTSNTSESTSDNTSNNDPKNDPKKDIKFNCKYCQKSFLKKNKARHYKRCKMKQANIVIEDDKKDNKQDTLTNFIDSEEELSGSDLIESDDKDNEIKKLRKELNELKELIKSNNNYSYSTNKKIIIPDKLTKKFIIDNLSPPNIEDILKEPPTKEQLKELKENDLTTTLFIEYFKEKLNYSKIKIKSLFCLDQSRFKYLVRTNNKWIVYTAENINKNLRDIFYNSLKEYLTITKKNIELLEDQPTEEIEKINERSRQYNKLLGLKYESFLYGLCEYFKLN